MGLYYLCSKNKGADQVCGYGTADLCLCFRSRFWPDVAHFTLDLALKLFFEGKMALFYFLPYMYADVVLPN